MWDAVYVIPLYGWSTSTFLSRLVFSYGDYGIFKYGVHVPYWVIPDKNIPFSDAKRICMTKHFDTMLFSATNIGYFSYGRVASFDSLITSKYSPFLTVQQFKHSTLLEVI